MAPWSPFLFWFLCILIATIAIVYLIRGTSSESDKEGFISISSCPTGSTNYITSNGDTNCCDSDVVDRQCNGAVVCSLSPKRPNGVPTCSDWITKEWTKRSSKFCTASIPYYYGTMAKTQGSTEGCSASPSTTDGSAPSDPTKPKCRIYQTSVDEYGKMDSCFNMRALDAMPLPSPNATKRLVTIGGPNLPAVLSATFSPPSNLSALPVTCYDWKRMEVYYNAQDPSGGTSRSQATVKDRHVNFCGAAKAYYVDGTLSVTNAIGVPPPPPAPMPAGADPRCYVNGKLVGTSKYVGNMGGNIQIYTSDECSKLGGTMPGEQGICVIANGDKKNLSQIYSLFCSTDPKIAKMAKS